MNPPMADDPKPSSPVGSPVDPAMIDDFTSASLRGEVGNAENWILQRVEGAALAPSSITTLRTIDLLVRNRGAIGTLWALPASEGPTPSGTEDMMATTPVMSDATEPSTSMVEQGMGHLEDRAWLLTHQLEPLGFLDVQGGGMGAIALAWHTKMRKEVVLKVANRPHLRERFDREIEVHAKLAGNANIVVSRTPLDYRGTAILVVDYVRGLSLGRWVELNGRMPWAEAAGCVRQAALGLGHAHAKGVIHRDVKPSNLVRSSRDGVISVIDWGLALDREGRDQGDLNLTVTGQFLGTPLYCPPEQAKAPGDATPASDLYGLGCVWHELMTGKPPFPSSRDNPLSLERLKAAHATEPVPALPAELEVPEGIEHVLRKLLDKTPDRRYPSAEDFIADLDRARRGVVDGPVGNPKPRWVAMAAVAAVLLAAWFSWPAPPSPSRIREVVIEVANPGGKPGRTGTVGSALFEAYSGDEVTIRGELTAPGYAYLIAFRPDGRMELCSTEGEAAVPERVRSPSYPPAGKPSVVFELNDGDGLQAFALVLSHAPLPSFRDWRASNGSCPWPSVKKVEPGVVWRSDGRTLETSKAPGNGGTRGAGGTSQGAKGAVAKLAEWLKSRPGVDEVVVEAFAVLPPRADRDRPGVESR